MNQLSAIEARVLGVLIEKDRTTPEQYPLSLNAVVVGSNQKNNRDPVMNIGENEVFDALESLRAKGLVIRSDAPGQRVNKYRHDTQEVLRLPANQIAILGELLLRGPQTLGELRGRASRMHPLESLDEVKQIIGAMSEREEPLVRELPPSPGSRAERYVQLLAPDAHPLETAAVNVDARPDPVRVSLETRVAALESEVARLAKVIDELTGATATS